MADRSPCMVTPFASCLKSPPGSAFVWRGFCISCTVMLISKFVQLKMHNFPLGHPTPLKLYNENPKLWNCYNELDICLIVSQKLGKNFSYFRKIQGDYIKEWNHRVRTFCTRTFRTGTFRTRTIRTWTFRTQFRTFCTQSINITIFAML